MEVFLVEQLEKKRPIMAKERSMRTIILFCLGNEISLFPSPEDN